MKQSISLLLLFVMTLSFCACHPSNHAGNGTPSVPATNPTVTDTPTEPAPTESITFAEPVTEKRMDGLYARPRIYYTIGSSPFGVSLLFVLDEQVYPDMTITVDIHTDTGSFLVSKPDTFGHASSGQEVSVPMSWFDVLWKEDYGDSSFQDYFSTHDAVFADAVIRADGHVVGYGIYEIVVEGNAAYFPSRYETYIFPMIDGQLQDVPLSYVQEQLAKLKETPFLLDYEEMVKMEQEFLDALATTGTEPPFPKHES